MSFYSFLEVDGYFDDGTGRKYWGKVAAGVLVIAEDTKNVLLVLRSNEVDNWLDGERYYGEMWGVPGGAVGGNKVSGVKKELLEETGYGGSIKLESSYVHNGRFYNFIGLVPKQFSPVLNWENDNFRWISFSDLMGSGRMLDGHPFIDGFHEFLNFAKDRIIEITD